ncbi:hypothetical protein J3E72DRAFT_391660 [Bipolaris maydis]|nr:hypothetical protein J3E72DRAFT_391660 [Bipolaris maydis]
MAPGFDNINALHQQRVKGLTEEPRLHPVWLHNRIFINPLPRYLLSCVSWDDYLDECSNKLGNDRSGIRRAAAGFLRTYKYLQLGLIPKDVDSPSFCRLTAELSSIDDAAVSGRYCYGELRLMQLNLHDPLLLRKFYFRQVHRQYGDFFARLYGPIPFVFALASTILSSMQVAFAAKQLVMSQWGPTYVLSLFVLLRLWMFLDERKLGKRAKGVTDPKC